MQIESVFEFLRQKRLAVVSTVHPSGAPQAALVGFATTAGGELVFDTLATARKALNLAQRPAVAMVVGWEDEITIQIEGVARPEGEDLLAAKAAYIATWPDGRVREVWPNLAYVVVRPKWIRYSCYAEPFVIEEFRPEWPKIGTTSKCRERPTS